MVLTGLLVFSESIPHSTGSLPKGNSYGKNELSFAGVKGERRSTFPAERLSSIPTKYQSYRLQMGNQHVRPVDGGLRRHPMRGVALIQGNPSCRLGITSNLIS